MRVVPVCEGGCRNLTSCDEQSTFVSWGSMSRDLGQLDHNTSNIKHSESLYNHHSMTWVALFAISHSIHEEAEARRAQAHQAA